MSPNVLSALKLIASNPRYLTERGHAIINRSIAELLRSGLVDYGSGARAYILTSAGREALK